jgi:TIR domain
VARIFISYRRADVDERAETLRKRLETVFGEENVFFDSASLRPGDVFPDRINAAIKTSNLFLALIGARWAGPSRDGSGRRLDEPNDFVRLELEAAFEHNIEVVPILMNGAALPGPAELPAALQPLLYRQAYEVRNGQWEADVQRLLDELNHRLGLIAWKAGPSRSLSASWSWFMAVAAIVLFSIAAGTLFCGQ